MKRFFAFVLAVLMITAVVFDGPFSAGLSAAAVYADSKAPAAEADGADAVVSGPEEGPEVSENVESAEAAENAAADGQTGAEEPSGTGESAGTDTAGRTGETAENAVTDETAEAAENAVTDETAEAAENAVTDETAEAAENAVTDETAEAAENTAADKTVEAEENAAAEETAGSGDQDDAEPVPEEDTEGKPDEEDHARLLAADEAPSDAFIQDETLRSVLRILVNYKTKKKADLYRTIDPYKTDITTLASVKDYDTPITRADLEASGLTVLNLAPYSGITSLKGLNNAVDLSEVVLPADLTAIEGKAFYQMNRLTKVTMPKTVTSVGDSAFEKCALLKNILVYDTDPKKPETQSGNVLNLKYVTEIGNSAFASCEGVEKAELFAGTGKIAIRSGAFNSCTKLAAVTIPEADLGTGIFASCYNLSTVKFHDSIKKVPDNTLTDIGRNKAAAVTFPKALEEIGAYACTGARIDTANLSVCTGLKAIGVCAFQNASFGTGCRLDLSACKGLTTIGHSAFAGLYLASPAVKLPDTVSTLGCGAFVGCNMTEVNIPSALTSIPDGTFMQCRSLSKVTAPSTSLVTSVGAHAFELCGHLQNIGFLSSMKGLTSIGDYAFSRCIPVKEETEVFDAEGKAAEPVWGLRLINVPNTVTELGRSVFENDFLVRDVVIGSGVSVLPERMMYCADSSSLSWQMVELQDPVSEGTVRYDYSSSSDTSYTELRNQYNYSSSLRSMSRLESVTMSDKVTEIGNSAFFGNSHLAKINAGTSGAKKLILPTALETIGSHAFDCCSTKSGSISNGDLKLEGIRYVKIPESISAIGEYAFANNLALENVTLPAALKELPAHCFDGCGYRESADGKYQYRGMTGVSDLTKLEVIGDYAFNNCYQLQSRLSEAGAVLGDLDFGRNLYSLGKYAFANTALKTASSLSSTKITKIDSYAFSGCRNLTTVYCPDTLESIGDYAFRDCAALDLINFPVYAELSKTMIYDAKSSVSFTPTLGRYRNTTFKVPINGEIILPAKAFTADTSAKISQVNSDSKTDVELEKADPRYYDVTLDTSKKNFKVSGRGLEVRGTAVRISVTLLFDHNAEKPMSIDFPTDVTPLHADPDSIAFTPDAVKYGGSLAGVTLAEENGVPVLLVSKTRVGTKLTLAAEAKTAEEENTGMITDPAVWEVISGDALQAVEDTTTKNTGTEVCTTTSEFTILNGKEAVVRLSFDDETDAPPARTIIVRPVAAISSIDFSLSSIGEGHMNPGSITMPVGQEDTLNVNAVWPEIRDRRDFQVLKSADDSIVSVDETGKLTALKAGRTQIRIGAASGNVSRSLAVTVKEEGSVIEPAFVDITGKVLADKRGYVYPGKTQNYTAVCLPDYAAQGVTWTISDPEALTLSAEENKAAVTGRTADAAATLTARAASGSASGNLTIVVTEPASKLKFAEAAPVVEAGTIHSLSVSGNELQTYGLIRLPQTCQDNMTFTSSNAAVLTLGTTQQDCANKSVKLSGKSATLYYTGLKNGTATITARSANGLTAKLKVTVVKKPITQLSFKETQITLLPGVKKKAKLTFEPVKSTEKVVWTSGNPEVAAVSSNGTVRAVGAGTAWITARSPIRGVSASFMVTVVGVGQNLTADGFTYTVNKGNTLTLAAVPYNGQNVTIPAAVKLSGKSYKVTQIGASALAGRTDIARVTIGKNVKTIKGKAFENCSSLKKVVFKTSVLKKINKNAFKTIAPGAVFVCPKKKLTAYRKLLKKSGLPAGAVIRK